MSHQQNTYDTQVGWVVGGVSALSSALCGIEIPSNGVAPKYLYFKQGTKPHRQMGQLYQKGYSLFGCH